MTRLAKAITSRREIARNRRILNKAISDASPAMRDELLVFAQRQSGIGR